MNAPPRMPKTLIASIAENLSRRVKDYEEAKGIFLDKCDRHVGQACDGFLRDVLVAEARYHLAAELHGMTHGEQGPLLVATARQIAVRYVEDLQRRIIRYTEFEANSTSAVHNLNRTYEAVARCKTLEWLQDVLVDTEESEQICDNCGHTGTFQRGFEHCDHCEHVAQIIERGQGEIH